MSVENSSEGFHTFSGGRPLSESTLSSSHYPPRFLLKMITLTETGSRCCTYDRLPNPVRPRRDPNRVGLCHLRIMLDVRTHSRHPGIISIRAQASVTPPNPLKETARYVLSKSKNQSPKSATRMCQTSNPRNCYTLNEIFNYHI